MYPKQLLFSLAIAKSLKEADPAVKIVFGGASIAAVNRKELLGAASFVDALMSGEGEEAVVLLAKDADFSTVPGLSYRKNGRIVENEKPRTITLRGLPIPDFSPFTFSRYLNPKPGSARTCVARLYVAEVRILRS